jgi:uncharacterized protein (TIGR02996 family)
MNLEEAFLADVVAHPNDATPWLVFADWLEERDDPRGELVRLWQQTHQQPDHPDLAEWHARLEELFTTGLRLPLPRHVNALGMECVWVPPGAFWMGGGDGKCGDRLVQMRQPFYFGIHLVTQGQWRALMGDNPGSFSRSGLGSSQMRDFSDADLDRFPIERVAMSSVQAFLGRLNESEQGSGWEYRLPTEEEWEYACRSPVPFPASSAACKTHCGFSFYLDQPSNSLSSEQANFDGNHPVNAARGHALARTTKVGSYPPNALGIHDLHGNLYEWTSSPSRVLPDVPGGLRVARGGCWASLGLKCTAADHVTSPQIHQSNGLGFRVARVFSG